MISFTLDIESKAKPAGMVVNGRITQNRNGYTDWKAKANWRLLQQMRGYPKVSFPLTSGQVYGVLSQHHVSSLKCGDLLNIVGAAMDTLVKAEIIRDDCPSIINRVICRMAKIQKPQTDRIEIELAMNRKEWVILLSQFE